ncbi:MAG: ferrochelatase [Abditibacteriales bacterium]|nr:ferrochelatase [Abditibacteriales bacterium]MDW8366955.1 ferrochelatase [Abditibacteriales bacterium]
MSFDAVLMIAFGGPEKPEDIRPFLANVTRGRPVPPARIEEVAHHYELVGGRSPLNEWTFKQARALETALKRSNVPPFQRPNVVFVGMRNWHPYLVDTVRDMAAAGVKRAIGLIMAPQQSQASWELYQKNVADAIAEAGVALNVAYAPPVFDYPLFIEAAADRVRAAMEQIPAEHRDRAMIVFTAHSVPHADPFHQRYAEQVATSARLVAERLQHPRWMVAYQSRSGRPTDPWLEPDIGDALRDLAAQGERYVVVVPIGFLCDHVEVLYDLDIEARSVAEQLGIQMVRAKTVHDDPKFIQALTEIVWSVVNG